MPFTLKTAGLLSPDTLRNDIVQEYNQTGGDESVSATDVFPLVELSNPTEKFFRDYVARLPMQQTSLTSESPISDLSDLVEDDVSVHTYKRKISPEKGVDTELNSEQEVLRLYQRAVNVLQMDVRLTREIISWQGDQYTDGMIGPNGATAHPELPAANVIAPATPYSDTANSTPHEDLMEAEFRIDESNTPMDGMGPITAFMSPSVLYDLKRNDDLEGRFAGVEVQGLTTEQVEGIIPFEEIELIRQQVVRTDAAGQPIDEAGAVVDDPRDAAKDNILEPWDPSLNAGAGGNRRNIVIGRPGPNSAMIPWFADRLAEHANNAPPSGDFAVDTNEGLLTQVWTENDPVISWLKVAQEIGFELLRPEAWSVIQNV